ncbi:hypothetical protein [Dysgonomonas sp. BGC7]|uniref:hypothetical protein n=1 Tax=Dysgonomonas sp. BGC7 TaxID=1658008 RepID=UPI000AD867CA|nr:hypothetical protein [Dysgonomonas sp. BGC7]MBD8388691.1 hypothetical protein [Dysgonomonas sp. BGC7]
MRVQIELEDSRTNATMMALHLLYLQKTYRQTKYSTFFSRIRPHEEVDFQQNAVITDKQLAQIIR